MRENADVGENGRFIAVFDSGVGGLSVLRHLQTELPHENLCYFADQIHLPYGEHSLETIKQFSAQITQFLLAQGAKLIVVACNTASAAALTQLRRRFPTVPFVGMEPAVKPAAKSTRSKVIGVLATQATFVSERYAALMAAYGADVQVIENPCLGLVGHIEAGEETAVFHLLQTVIPPMLDAGADTLVLGCTHYPFMIKQIKQIAGDGIQIIDPAPAVARQARRVLHKHQQQSENAGSRTVRMITTGNSATFAQQLQRLGFGRIGVETAVWQNNQLTLKNRV